MGEKGDFFGVVLTGQVLPDDTIISWNKKFILRNEFGDNSLEINTDNWIKSIFEIKMVNESKENTGSTYNVMINYKNSKMDLIECDIQLYGKLTQHVNDKNIKENRPVLIGCSFAFILFILFIFLVIIINPKH